MIKNMKFDTLLEYVLVKIFGSKAISDLCYSSIGDHFPKRPTSVVTFSAFSMRGSIPPTNFIPVPIVISNLMKF